MSGDAAPLVRHIVRGAALLALALLAACAGPPRQPSTPVVVRETARWVPVDWQQLPGWHDDRLLDAWPALLRSCERPAATWTTACASARKVAPRTETEAREWFDRNLQPYRVESLQGGTDGLLTGYYEPQLDARRTPTREYKVPLRRVPADLQSRQPYWTRREIDTLPAAQASLRGTEIAYVADPLSALALQIQGSGRLRVTERDGKQRMIRLAYAGNNGQPYQSVGRWLIDNGELPAGQASWPAIRDWARRNPRRVDELIWANPRYVFFREEPLVDATQGPRGAQGVPLTPGRSIAVDPRSIPYGTPAWLDSTEPASNRPLRRLVLAQDTGSAITGAVRADYFWGWERDAAEQAGRMKQPLRLWVLAPRP